MERPQYKIMISQCVFPFKQRQRFLFFHTAPLTYLLIVLRGKVSLTFSPKDTFVKHVFYSPQ